LSVRFDLRLIRGHFIWGHKSIFTHLAHTQGEGIYSENEEIRPFETWELHIQRHSATTQTRECFPVTYSRYLCVSKVIPDLRRLNLSFRSSLVCAQTQFIKPSAQIFTYAVEYVFSLPNSQDKETTLDDLVAIRKQNSLE
jgi:hypothetical protein